MPDLLYILGTGSRWNDNEIRYSLRSASMHFPHRRVVVVGERPPWMRGIHYISCRDHYGDMKLKNSIYKLATAVRDTSLSNEFVLMNDDFFFLRDMKELPIGYRGLLKTTLIKHPTKNGYYFRALCTAYDRLKAYGISEPKDFSLHEPMRMRRDLVLETMQVFGGAGNGYLFRTMYGNLHVQGAARRTDRKIKAWSPSMGDKLQGLNFFSTDPNVVLDAGFQRWIEQRYPEKSKYEGSAYL